MKSQLQLFMIGGFHNSFPCDNGSWLLVKAENFDLAVSNTAVYRIVIVLIPLES